MGASLASASAYAFTDVLVITAIIICSEIAISLNATMNAVTLWMPVRYLSKLFQNTIPIFLANKRSGS